MLQEKEPKTFLDRYVRMLILAGITLFGIYRSALVNTNIVAEPIFLLFIVIFVISFSILGFILATKG